MAKKKRKITKNRKQKSSTAKKRFRRRINNIEITKKTNGWYIARPVIKGKVQAKKILQTSKSLTQLEAWAKGTKKYTNTCSCKK